MEMLKIKIKVIAKFFSVFKNGNMKLLKYKMLPPQRRVTAIPLTKSTCGTIG